jgi:hypothetical protein
MVGGINNWSMIMKVSAGVASLGTIVGLAFAAYFVITDAIGEESKTRQIQVEQLKLQDQADDVDFEIYKVAKQMDEIENRMANNVGYHGDSQRLKQLQRQLDILLRRQNSVLLRIEGKVK